MIKLLFLPHCLNPEYIEPLKQAGIEKGYETHVVGGGSIVKNMLMQKYQKGENIEKVIGIACGDELKLAASYTKPLAERGVELVAVQLTKDGCKDTEVNLEEALAAIEGKVSQKNCRL